MDERGKADKAVQATLRVYCRIVERPVKDRSWLDAARLAEAAFNAAKAEADFLEAVEMVTGRCGGGEG